MLAADDFPGVGTKGEVETTQGVPRVEYETRVALQGKMDSSSLLPWPPGVLRSICWKVLPPESAPDLVPQVGAALVS